MYICKNCGYKMTDDIVTKIYEISNKKLSNIYCIKCRNTSLVYINELENRATKYKKSMGC